MFVGFVNLGDTLVFPVLTDDAGVPTNADDAPTWIAYNPNIASALTNGTSVAISGLTGAYRVSVACTEGNGFVAGTLFTVLADYAISTDDRRQSFTFMVC